jgi:hypothetical protein
MTKTKQQYRIVDRLGLVVAELDDNVIYDAESTPLARIVDRADGYRIDVAFPRLIGFVMRAGEIFERGEDGPHGYQERIGDLRDAVGMFSHADNRRTPVWVLCTAYFIHRRKAADLLAVERAYDGLKELLPTLPCAAKSELARLLRVSNPAPSSVDAAPSRAPYAAGRSRGRAIGAARAHSARR